MDIKSILKMEKINNKNDMIIRNIFKFKISKIVKAMILLFLFINLLIDSKFKKYLENKDISEKIKLLKKMTNNDKNEFNGIKNCLEGDPDRLHCIYHLINTKEVIGKKKILLGIKKDGCYVFWMI